MVAARQSGSENLAIFTRERSSMKTCQSCGERAQDAAHVCNICGQDFGVEETRETSLPRKRSEKRVLLSLVLAVAAGALLLVASVEYRSSGGVSLTGRSRADRLRPPHIILIASGSEMEIGA